MRYIDARDVLWIGAGVVAMLLLYLVTGTLTPIDFAFVPGTFLAGWMIGPLIIDFFERRQKKKAKKRDGAVLDSNKSTRR